MRTVVHGTSCEVEEGSFQRRAFGKVGVSASASVNVSMIEVYRVHCELDVDGSESVCGLGVLRAPLLGLRRPVGPRPCVKQLCVLRVGLHIPRQLSLYFDQLKVKLDRGRVLDDWHLHFPKSGKSILVIWP